MTDYKLMNFRKLIITSFVCLASFACKKEEEGTVMPSLDGYLTIKGLPEFVAPGTSFELTPEGAIHPDGKELGYYWKISPTKPAACTTKVYTAEFSDTLQTCTVYCYAYATGYSGMSASSYVTVVKSGKDGSIQGIDYPDDAIIAEDGTYYYKQIGNQTWTINNIAEKSSGKAYKNTDVMSDILGRYYSYEQAKAVCASLSTANQTWALPGLDDWKALESHVNATLTSDPDAGKSLAAALMADATFNGQTMWKYRPKVGDITNSSGFSALPSGYTNLKTSAFKGVNEYATFWTETETDNSDEAYSVYLNFEEPELFIRKADKESFGASVRCILK